MEEQVAEATADRRWVIYLQGAEYLIEVDEKLELAEKWLLESEKAMTDFKEDWNIQYYPKEYITGHLFWTQAKLQAKKGNYQKALELSKKMKDIEGSYVFYKKENESESIDILMTKWNTAK